MTSLTFDINHRCQFIEVGGKCQICGKESITTTSPYPIGTKGFTNSSMNQKSLDKMKSKEIKSQTEGKKDYILNIKI